MKFIYSKNDLKDFNRGQENCYLITNGLGGFSSLTMIGSNARNDHALLMACLKAPNNRVNMLSNVGEKLIVGDVEYDLCSQEYADFSLNRKGFKYISKFTFEDVPMWTYNVFGVEITKTIAMSHGENTLCLKYIINNRTDNRVELIVTPYMEFVKKGQVLDKSQEFICKENTIESNNYILNFKTNGLCNKYETIYVDNLYFEHDKRDGRNEIGCIAYNHDIIFETPSNTTKEFYIIYSTSKNSETAEDIIKNAVSYRNNLVDKAEIKNEIGKMLVKSAEQFVVNRDSTKGKSIIAGYPFFEDWGRDTMISLSGVTIATKQFENAKSIFRTFIKYCKNGIMPNLFPEGKSQAMYNTVDASLLFINSIYEYYKVTKDLEFIEEAYRVMEDIIYWYRRGTNFDIKMDDDGLIKAGSGYDQVTWMDVRVNDILPTPRHGKPVEINAYWYSALRIMDELAKELNKDAKDYYSLSELVKESFNKEFWNEKNSCLKDVISGTSADNQIRCNQIYAVSMPFTMLESDKERKVVEKVFEKLYTPYGLRTLSMDDKEFKGFYGGSQLNRDLSYHQGTVWMFPLGAYYLAYLKINHYSKKSINIVKNELEVMESCLREGCIGQLAEIYDGENPTISKGCFAQAWSVSEILKVYRIIEDKEN